MNSLRATGTTGVLAEVGGAGRPLAARAGVADAATGEPVPWDAKHRIASTTKTFVATVVLQLVGEGKIGLTDNAVTSDGRRAGTVAVASSVELGQSPIEQYKASAALIDHALCGTR